jgi:predicted dehydrogenase
MDKTLGIGVIGLGMGRDLLYTNTDPQTAFEVRALCAATPGKAERLAAERGVGFATTRYEELCERPDVDVVAVYSPDHLHYEHCKRALECGKHVLVTKPMVTSAEHAVELTRLSESKRLKFQVGETCRWYSSFRAAKRFYDDGDLGEIIYAEGHYVHEIKDFFQTTTWRLTAPQDFIYGGVCHPLDSLVWFLGDIDEVHCLASRGGLSPYPKEENFTLNLRFPSGVIAHVLGLYGIVHPPMPMMGLTIAGTRATATATFEDFQPSEVRIVFDKLDRNEPAVINYPADTEGAYGQGEAVRRYVADLEDAILNDYRPQEDAREGTKTIAALDAAWESVRTGKAIKVKYEI